MAFAHRSIRLVFVVLAVLSPLSRSVLAQLDCTGDCDATIALVAVGANGPHEIVNGSIFLQPGLVAELEIRIANWDSDGDGSPRLSSWLVRFIPENFTQGLANTGALAAHWPPCSVDAECQAQVHPLATCVGSGSYDGGDNVPQRCTHVVYDTQRPDYAFDAFSIHSFDPPGGLEFRIADVALVGGATDPGQPVYGATFFVEIPPGTAGLFTLGFDEVNTYLWNNDSQAFIEPLLIQPVNILVLEPTCDGVDDCSGNGECVGFDLCECSSGWSGSDCSAIDCAGLNDCSGNGTCVAPEVCACDPGWTGADCSLEVMGRVSLVPIAANGNYRIEKNEITVLPGQPVFLEIQLADWDRDRDGVPLLSEYQITMDSSSYSSGTRGELAPFTPPCPPTYCSVAVLANAGCDVDNTCIAGMVDHNDETNLFASVASTGQVDRTTLDYRFWAAATGVAVPDFGDPRHAGFIVLKVPPDAAGTFTVRVSEAPFETFLLDSKGIPLGTLAFSPARITVASSEDDLFTRENRFLTISTGRPGRSDAIRVTFADLNAGFSVFNGTTMWVSQPWKVSASTQKGVDDPVDASEDFLWVATLACDPAYVEWSQFSKPIHVFHELIVPDSSFEIQSVDSALNPTLVDDLPVPFVSSTPRWGDVAGLFDVESQRWTPPNVDTGALSDIADVLALVQGFTGTPGPTEKLRWDLQGTGTGLIDGTIDIGDVLVGVQAFSNLAYPFPPPTAAPCP